MKKLIISAILIMGCSPVWAQNDSATLRGELLPTGNIIWHHSGAGTSIKILDGLKIFYISPSGSYMTADSCWHIKDTLGTINDFFKWNLSQQKQMLKSQENKDKIIKSASNIIATLNFLDGRPFSKKQFYLAVKDYLTATKGTIKFHQHKQLIIRRYL